MDSYIENYIIAETKESYRVNHFWQHWLYRGLFAAISSDKRTVAGWGIMDSES